MMPHCRPTADVTRITTMPLSFVEEVHLAAKRGRDKGWLRLLGAEDVRGEPFEREGMRLGGGASAMGKT